MPDRRFPAWFPVAAVVGATVIPWLLAEGVHILVKGSQAETSLAYTFFHDLTTPKPAGEANIHDPASRMLVRMDQIEPLLGVMKENGVGLGNSPFSSLKTEEASVNSEKGPCLEQKPNIRKKMGYLRTNLFNPFDQMSFFVDADRKLPAELQAFFDRYAFRVVNHTTNEFGERNTFPKVDAQRLVLVAGDSVANGLAIDDTETLASQLQARDRSRRYVNLGIARANAHDITCALDRAAGRYHGHIDEVIYVLCENDFDQGGPLSDPAELTDWLAAYQKREGAKKLTLIVSPLIYNVVPEVTRLRGHSHFDWPTFLEQRTRVMQLAREKGFGVIDMVDVGTAEGVRGKSQFAPLALYVDHAHWSPTGVSRVVDALTAIGAALPPPAPTPASAPAPAAAPQPAAAARPAPALVGSADW